MKEVEHIWMYNSALPSELWGPNDKFIDVKSLGILLNISREICDNLYLL